MAAEELLKGTGMDGDPKLNKVGKCAPVVIQTVPTYFLPCWRVVLDSLVLLSVGRNTPILTKKTPFLKGGPEIAEGPKK